MRRWGPWLALALVVVTNAVVLLGVVRNRQGEPEATLVLTERELPPMTADRENTGLSLRLVWHPPFVRHAPGESPFTDTLGIDTLRSLGFDVSVPPTDPRADLHYGKARPLQCYAVLELEGPAWQAWLDGERAEIERLRHDTPPGSEAERTLRTREERFAAAQLTRSRLTLVDVGPDPAELRRRHPDRAHALVAPAVVRLTLDRPWNERRRKVGAPRLRGYVSEILVSDIHVPRPLRAPLDAVIAAAPRPTRYRAVLSYGHRLEPWLRDIRPLAPGGE